MAKRNPSIVAVVAAFTLVSSLVTATPALADQVTEIPMAAPEVESTAADPVVPTVPEGDFSVDEADLSTGDLAHDRHLR